MLSSVPLAFGKVRMRAAEMKDVGVIKPFVVAPDWPGVSLYQGATGRAPELSITGGDDPRLFDHFQLAACPS